MGCNRESGFSLIELMVALAIMTLLTISFAELTQQEAAAQKKTTQKFDTLDLKQGLQTTMSNSANCDCQVTSLPPFNGTQPDAFIDLARIKQGCAPGAPDLAVAHAKLPNSQSLGASTVRLAKLNKTGVDQYTGVFQVSFDTATTSLPWAPVEVTQVLQTDPASPPTAVRIIGCGTSLAGPPAKPFRTWIGCAAPNNGSATCIDDIYATLQLFRYGVPRSAVHIQAQSRMSYASNGCGNGSCMGYSMGVVNGYIQTVIFQSSQTFQVDVTW